MKVRRRIAGVTAVLVMVVGIITMTAGAAQAAPPPVQLGTNMGGSSLCFNRNGGGTGFDTSIIGWSCGDTNNFFQYQFLPDKCGDGHVHGSAGCPFANGTRLNDLFDGWIIEALRSTDTGLCAGTAATFGTGDANLRLVACPNGRGDNGGFGDIFVINPTNDPREIVNVRWSNWETTRAGQPTVAQACAYTRGKAINTNFVVGFPIPNQCRWNELF